jgi:hypothetical protein
VLNTHVPVHGAQRSRRWSQVNLYNASRCNCHFYEGNANRVILHELSYTKVSAKAGVKHPHPRPRGAGFEGMMEGVRAYEVRLHRPWDEQMQMQSGE